MYQFDILSFCQGSKNVVKSTDIDNIDLFLGKIGELWEILENNLTFR